jgi:glycerol kinase
MLMNTGSNKTLSKNGLLTTIGYAMNGDITYALEGSVFVAGSAVQWLRDQLEFFKQAKDSETLATNVDSSNGVIVVPAFAGLGTPYWVSQAKGAMFGITRSTTKNHITRATLESLAYQTKDIIDVMSKESNISPQFLKVDGGASLNNFLMQFQADILNIDIIRPINSESTALGAAFMSGLSVGFFKDLDEITQLLTIDKEFNPQMSDEQRNKLYAKWQKAVQATITFQ